MEKPYVASKTRTQGREGWSVIFRHPARLDASGKYGRRVRRGLGTKDEVEADRLVEQLNELLRSPELWTSRDLVPSTVDRLVVEIFYDGIQRIRPDFQALREAIVPMPDADADYRTLLLLGTTGAGKTTVVRQLLGTDPETERFPSTSTAKTTVADTELIFDPDPTFRAVVTFVGREEVVDHLTECVSEAALAVLRGADDREVERRLLDHVNQRYRFSYILGRRVQDDDDLDDDLEEEPGSFAEGGLGEVDLEETAEVIISSVITVRDLVAKYETTVREELGDGESDERVLEELIEETLDEALRGDEGFHGVVDALFDEIEKRFELLTVGEVRRDRGWPTTWSWETEDRAQLVRAVTRFSSNYAPLFGTLLTPLVNGIRVAGPFSPKWLTDRSAPRLVLIDGEGLGHVASSAAALPTTVSRRIDAVDAVLLVDNAAQPMQAAPVAAMKAVVTSGNASKLLFCFSHFDMVKGDNLPSFSDREAHVLASGENVLKSIGDDLGPFAERVLRQRLATGCFFVGGIDADLDPTKKSARRTIDQLTGILDAVDRILDRPDDTEVRPVYDRVNLVLAVREASETFHETWRGLLGLDYNPAAPKEHWTRIKALSRRLAEDWADQYDTLRPVAELKRALEQQIYRMLQQPVRWDGGSPSDDEKQVIVDAFANAIAKELLELSSRRIDTDRKGAWQAAYAEWGTGSTFRRARIIAADVYERGAPVPNVTPSPDQNSFLHELTAIVDRLATDLGIVLV